MTTAVFDIETVPTFKTPAGVYYLWQMWQHEDSFIAADQWILSLGGDQVARWCHEMGNSYIDGIVYPAAVYFRSTEDYIMFKLQWPELLKF